jgi:hypothetical protein
MRLLVPTSGSFATTMILVLGFFLIAATHPVENGISGTLILGVGVLLIIMDFMRSFQLLQQTCCLLMNERENADSMAREILVKINIISNVNERQWNT